MHVSSPTLPISAPSLRRPSTASSTTAAGTLSTQTTRPPCPSLPSRSLPRLRTWCAFSWSLSFLSEGYRSEEMGHHRCIENMDTGCPCNLLPIRSPSVPVFSVPTLYQLARHAHPYRNHTNPVFVLPQTRPYINLRKNHHPTQLIVDTGGRDVEVGRVVYYRPNEYLPSEVPHTDLLRRLVFPGRTHTHTHLLTQTRTHTFTHS